MIAMDQ